VTLTNAVELFVQSQCERDKTDTEVSNVKIQATKTIKVIEVKTTESI